MIELVRYLYTQFHLWAFVLSAFAFIALWFTQPRLALKRGNAGKSCTKFTLKNTVIYIPVFFILL